VRIESRKIRARQAGTVILAILAALSILLSGSNNRPVSSKDCSLSGGLAVCWRSLDKTI
jgi:hypothetical protein